MLNTPFILESSDPLTAIKRLLESILLRTLSMVPNIVLSRLLTIISKLLPKRLTTSIT